MTLLSRCFYKTLTRRVFRTQSNIEDGTIYGNYERLKSITIFAKSSIVDV